MQQFPLVAVVYAMAVVVCLTGCGERDSASASTAAAGSSSVNPAIDLDGRWKAQTADGSEHTLELRASGGALLGFVTLTGGGRRALANGRADGAEIEFSTLEDGIPWQWIGHVANGRIEGVRLAAGSSQGERFHATREQDASVASVLGVSLGGHWVALIDTTEYSLELDAEGVDLRGQVSLQEGPKDKIVLGMFSGDAFLFRTQNESGWLWSGVLADDQLRGHRENIESGRIERFRAHRRP